MNPTYTILHLADLHFGELAKNHTFCHAFGLSNGGPVTDFVKYCVDALHGKQPTFIVVAGDLVCRGSDRKQHKQALANLNALCEELGFGNQDLRRVLIVPGNHDVHRDPPKGSYPLAAHVEELLHPFYAPLAGEMKRRLVPSNWGSNRNANTPTEQADPVYPSAEWIIPFEDLRVVFILLHSPVTFRRLLLPRNSSRKNLPSWRLHDHGLIVEQHWQQVRKEFQGLEIPADYLKIAVFHHNPLPLVRPSPRIDHNASVETNMLANGPEVIEALKDLGVSVILHGHRHQSAILSSAPEDTLAIIGAPSAGLSAEALLHRAPDCTVPEIPHSWMGFNLIDVEQLAYGTTIHVRPFEHASQGTTYFQPKKSIRVPLFLKLGWPVRLTSFQEGVDHLAQEVLRAPYGVTMLHHHESATWNPHRDNQHCDALVELPPDNNEEKDEEHPFKVLWKPLLSENSAALNALTGHLFQSKTTHDNVEATRTMIEDSIRERKYTPGFRTKLLDGDVLTPREIQDAIQKETNSRFADYLNALAENAVQRATLYALELYRLATDPDFSLTKCIYFHAPNDKNDSASPTRLKFAWLLNSLIYYRGLKNVHIAWAPFALDGSYGQSFVSIPRHRNKAAATTIMMGWNEEENHTPAARNRISVFEMDATYGGNAPGGTLSRDVRAVLSKAIHPIVERLRHDFPLFEDGKLFKSRLKRLARKYGCVKLVSADFLEKFDQHPREKDPVMGRRADRVRLRKLFQGCLPTPQPSTDLAWQWNSNDKKFLLGCQGRNK